MLRRNNSKINSSLVEQTTLASFTGTKGINSKNAPTVRDTVNTLINLDVDDDGGLVLRNPIILHRKYSLNNQSPIFVNYIYNNFILTIYDKSNSIPIRFYNSNGEEVHFTIKFNLANGTEKSITDLSSENLADYFDFTNVKLINATSASILSNVKITTALVNTNLIHKTDLYRYVQIIYNDETQEFTLTVKEPTLNTLATQSNNEYFSLNPNTTLDYIYAIRDNYYSQTVSIAGILAYGLTNENEDSIYPSTDELDTSAYTVATLTEKEPQGLAYRLISTINKSFNAPFYLKAFMNFKNTSNTCLLCNWKKTYNGVDWLDIPSFLESPGTIANIEITDTTSSNETLDSSYSKTIEKLKFFTFEDQDDKIVDSNLSSRKDILKIDNVSTSDITATYKFSIYSMRADIVDLFIFNKQVRCAVSTGTLAYSNVYKKTDYYIYDATVNLYDGTLPPNDLEYPDKECTFGTRITLNVLSLDNINLSKFKIYSIQSSSKTLETNYQLTPNINASIIDSLTIELKFTKPLNFKTCKYVFYKYYKIYYDDKFYTDVKVVFRINKDIPLPPNLSNVKIEASKVTVSDGITFSGYSYAFYADVTNNNDVDATLAVFNKYNFDNDLPEEFSNATYSNPVTIPAHSTVTYKWISGVYNRNTDWTSLKFQIVPYFKTVGGNNSINGPAINSLNLTIKSSDFTSFPTTINLTNTVTNNKVSTDINFTLMDSDVDETLFSTPLLIDSSTFSFLVVSDNEFLTDKDLTTTVIGEHLYYKKSLYAYGASQFQNNIYPSDVGSFVTPLFNIIDLDTNGSNLITSVISWRDYLIAFSETSCYLITKVENGYTSKIINNFIGISYADRKTAKAILNGVIFKSKNKIYSLQPNYYSSVDNILNISEISSPINHLLEDNNEETFAITTDKYYYLFVPKDTSTRVFKYEYSRRIWTVLDIKRKIVDYYILSVNDIRIFDNNGHEYYFDSDVKNYSPDLDQAFNNYLPYGDYYDNTIDELLQYGNAGIELNNSQIEFIIDSGEKTDNLAVTKQFVETKIILATQSSKDTFPLTVTVKTDGIYQKLHTDCNTDSALWKNVITDVGTLSTDFVNNSSNILNTLRQLILRYSGKGKTISHYISGKSQCKFKIFVVYYKYKLLPVKQ